MARSADSWMAAVATVVAAAIAYVDSEEPGETKNLLFNLESAVRVYRSENSAPRTLPKEEQVWIQCRPCDATGAADHLGECENCTGAGGWYTAASKAPAVDEHGERWA